MDKRVKSEQFRKRKKNYFERAYEIGITCETGIFVLFERNGKIYTFTNMDELPTQEEIERKLYDSKTAADFEATSRTKIAKKTTSSPPRTSDNVSSFSTLGIKNPDPPQLDLSFLD